MRTADLLFVYLMDLSYGFWPKLRRLPIGAITGEQKLSIILPAEPAYTDKNASYKVAAAGQYGKPIAASP